MDDDKKWEDLDLSGDELKRLSEALKKEEFRKLLVEYAEEISDPVNRKKYEDEIAQLENERGMDVKFVNPEPGYVIKTTANGNIKTFINVSKNEHVEKPKCTKKAGPDGKLGHQWSIPHSFAPVREDSDKSGNKCNVIDFVVNPETYRMAETNFRFKQMLQDTAFDGVERQFDMKLDRKNVKHPNTKFKGTPTATVIRTKKDDNTEVVKEMDPNDPLSKVGYPYGDKTSAELGNKQKKQAPKHETDKNKLANNVKSEYELPRYNILHRGYFDLQDFRAAPDVKQSTRPKELVVDIDLPLLTSAGCVDLDVLPKKLTLKSEKPAKYKLELDLPYEVDEEHGGAKFDKSKRKLIITLPVVAAKLRPAPFTGNSDALQSMDAEGDHLNDELDMKLPGDATVEEKPLIEVLSNEHNGSDLPTNHANGDCSETDVKTMNGDAETDAVLNGKIDARSIETPKFYTFPSFDYLQDDETVTVILDIKNGVRESLTKQFSHVQDKCYGLLLTIKSLGSGGFPMHYRTAIQFDLICMVEEENSYIDVGQHNVVITFIKNDTCLGHWDRFLIGQNENDLQEKLFLSEQTLKKELDALDQQISSQVPVNRDELPNIEVKDMNSSKLSVEITGGSSTRLKRTVSESGEEIEVVHRHQPRIQGILKQRTASESSDDISGGAYGRQVSTGNDSTSPISESDEALDLTSGDDSSGQVLSERKKSVSFNEHIDSATFRCNQSVSSMRETLKNKRRKQRKHDKRNKPGARRRRNSNSLSEVSSDDASASDAPAVTTSTKSMTTTSHSKQKADQSVAVSKLDAVVPSDIVADTPAAESGDSTATAECDQKQLRNMENSSEPTTIEQSVEDSIAADCNTAKSEQSARVLSTDQSDTTVKQHGVKKAVNCDVVNGDAAHVNGNGKATNGYDSDDYDVDEKDANDNIPSSGKDATCAAPAKNADAPETMLNWKDIPNHEGLKPHCAVDLSNSIMFDLDVD